MESTSKRDYNHNSLKECIYFVESAPCLFRKIDKLSYIMNYLKERGSEEFLVIPRWKPSIINKDLERMAEDAIKHLKESVKSAFYKDITSTEPTAQ